MAVKIEWANDGIHNNILGKFYDIRLADGYSAGETKERLHPQINF